MLGGEIFTRVNGTHLRIANYWVYSSGKIQIPITLGMGKIYLARLVTDNDKEVILTKEGRDYKKNPILTQDG